MRGKNMVMHFTKVKIVGLVFLTILLLVFKVSTEAPHIAGFKKSDLKKVMEITGVTYDGTLEDLVKVTQKAWLRPAGKERWEIEQQPYENKRAELLPVFKSMGLVDAWKIKDTSFEHILFMGATVARMALRMETLQEVLEMPVAYKDIIFLSGGRSLIQEEKDFLKKRGWNPIATTEGGVYPRLFEENKIPLNKVVFINASETVQPDGKVWRPTTADCVRDWLKENPTPGLTLVISSQPFCHYQKIVAESLLPETFVVKAVGVKAPESTTVAVYLDTLARTIYQWVTTTQKNKK
jgi:hypothetical protein